MKRKLLILFLAVISCIACVFGVTACNTEKPDDSGNSGNGQGTIQTPPDNNPSNPDKNPNDTQNTNVVKATSVTLNKTTLTLEVGGEETLTATVKPDNATNRRAVWESSDKTVAKVSRVGTVTALKAGTATITATAGDKNTVCKVTVKNKNFKNLIFEPETFTYDGTEKSLAVSNLPLGAEVVYEGNGKINAGIYNVTATVSMKDYQSVVLKSKLTIEKRELTVVFSGETNLTYTGTEQKTISVFATNLVGNDTVNIFVSYSGDMVEAGRYVATANVVANQNYKLTYDNTVKFPYTA